MNDNPNGTPDEPPSAPANEPQEAEPLEHVNPAPQYPRLAIQRNWEGIVQLRVRVSEHEGRHLFVH